MVYDKAIYTNLRSVVIQEKCQVCNKKGHIKVNCDMFVKNLFIKELV